MMKLIKLLFPKVYTSIFNEGYAKGQLDYSESGPIDDYQYDDDEYRFEDPYEGYPPEFWDLTEEELEGYKCFLTGEKPAKKRMPHGPI